LKGLAKVAAVNCDEEMNKAFCTGMGIQGFPTLKIVRPGKRTGTPIIEDYRGGRTAKSMVETVVDKIPNHVEKLTTAKVEGWLSENNGTSKAILFTKKGATSALYRSLAIDFLGSISFAQMRHTEKGVEDIFGITDFPKLVLLPGGDQESIVYDGDLKKETMSAFLSQIAKPNQDPPPASPKKKKDSTKKGKKSKNEKSSKKTADEASPKSEKSEESVNQKAAEQMPLDNEPAAEPVADKEATTEDEEESLEPEKPKVTRPPPLPFISTPDELQKLCFNPKAGTCLIALLPEMGDEEEPSEGVIEGLSSLQYIRHKRKSKGDKLFPFYAIPAENEVNTYLRKTLTVEGQEKLGNNGQLEVFVVNAKRGWWRRYRSESARDSGFGPMELELWIEHVRSGAGMKEAMPKGAVKSTEKEEADDREAESIVDSLKDKAQNIKESVAEQVADVIDKLKPAEAEETEVVLEDKKRETSASSEAESHEEL
jgi:protein disulfide-isomerase A6